MRSDQKPIKVCLNIGGYAANKRKCRTQKSKGKKHECWSYRLAVRETLEY